MLPITASNPIKWRHYPGDIIMWCVRWYLRYPISFTHMAEMANERGLSIDASCIWRWVQVYGPELDKRCRRHLKQTTGAGGWMRRTSRSKVVIDSCIELWTRQVKRSTSC